MFDKDSLGYKVNVILLDQDQDVRLWQIWAAKMRTCPTCSAEPFTPCYNLADVNRVQYPRRNQYPHEDRIDWVKLHTYLTNVMNW